MVTKSDGMRNEILMPEAVRSYLQQHKLDEIVVAALNSCAKVMPDDPFGHIAIRLAENCSAPPTFIKLEYDPLEPGDLRFHVVASIRGIHVRVHTLSFDGVLFQKPPAPDETEEAVQLSRQVSQQSEAVSGAGGVSLLEALSEQVEANEREKILVSFLEGFFKTAFENVFVDDLTSFNERCAGLIDAPVPGEGFTVDLPRATAFLTNELINTAAQCLSTSGLELFQSALARAGVAEFSTPPLKTPEDLSLWRGQSMWPLISMPVFYGGGPSVLRVPALRFCAAFTPFAAPATTPDAPEDCPSLDWFSVVCQLARDARAEAVKGLQADKALASLVVDGIAYGHPEGLLQTARLARKAAEAAAGELGPSETSGVLLAYATEAWVAEEDVYEFETGKKLTLEELVNLYGELAEEGWVKMVVQPFRQEDLSAGCELLRARAPGLRLVADLTGTIHKSKLKGEAYSCPLRPSGSVPEVLRQYSELVELWREADGCGRCIFLDNNVAEAAPPIMDMLLACSHSEVILLPEDIADEGIAQLSRRVDDVLCHVLYAHEEVVI